MADKTKIEWCDATWNPITGCTPCSPGCDHCYAAILARRFPGLHDAGNPLWPAMPFYRQQFHPERLDKPLHWRKPRRIFVGSMTDMFHDAMRPDWLISVLNIILTADWHTYMLLTKRPQNVGAALWELPNVWLGVTVCNQAEADAKIPVLLQTPAALRFVSVEPMLGAVDLEKFLCARTDKNGEPIGLRRDGIDWVICGGETGPGARKTHWTWPNDLRDQCAATGVPFFYKGWGTAHAPKSHPHYHWLDAREWHEFPKTQEG